MLTITSQEIPPDRGFAMRRTVVGLGLLLLAAPAVAANPDRPAHVLDPDTGIPSRNDSRRAFTSSPGINSVGVELEGDVDAVLPNMFDPNRLDGGQPVRPTGPIGPVRIADVLPGGPAQLAGV